MTDGPGLFEAQTGGLVQRRVAGDQLGLGEGRRLHLLRRRELVGLDALDGGLVRLALGGGRDEPLRLAREVRVRDGLERRRDLVVQAAEGLGLRDLQRALAVAVEREAGLGEARDVNGAVSNADLENMLDGSSGNILDLSLLGAEFADFGSVTLNVPVSTLDASDFIIG